MSISCPAMAAAIWKVEDFLERHGVRAHASDLVSEERRTGLEVGLLERLNRQAERRSIVRRIGSRECGDHQVEIGTGVHILR